MLDFVPTALRNFLSKPATRLYPFTVRRPYQSQRGHIAIDIHSCIFCGLCARKCPTGALEVNRADKTWQIDRFKCIMCGACVATCPKKCLSVEPQYSAPAPTKSSDLFKLPQEAEAEEAAQQPDQKAVGATEGV
jgi:ech hydrogenase subunit F